MADNRSPLPRQPATSLKNELLIPVGAHAFVHMPEVRKGETRPVPILDYNGKSVENDLVDSQEVEILAWHPKAREGLAYQVRRMGDGREWWILARYLRKSRTVVER